MQGQVFLAGILWRVCISKVPEYFMDFALNNKFWFVHYYIYSLRVFSHTTLADGLSLESEWLQVLSSLRDSSVFRPIITRLWFVWSRFVLWFQPFLPNLCSKCSKYNCDPQLPFMFHSFLSSQGRSKYSSLFSFSLIFTLSSIGTVKSTFWLFFFSFLFFLLLSLGLVFWPGLGDLFQSRNPREICASRSRGVILDCALYH